MGLFDVFKRKNCDICGGEIGLLGNRKLEDGNCCKTCAGKLSPWFDERRHSTVGQIKEQLAYREANEAAVKAFCVTKVVGEKYLVYFDQKTRSFFVTDRQDYQSENPDVISYDQVLSCELNMDESKTEIMREVTDKEGNTKEVSCIPKRFLWEYDFEMVIRVRHPYFDDMRFRLNDRTVELESKGTETVDPMRNIGCRKYISMSEEIRELLTAAPEAAPESLAAEVPGTAARRFCENCGAPNSGGKFCENCGSRLQ